ncbi:hypothetical protein Q4560_17970 [Celeribacter halophilus]|nr:hypothetical protein [Celeribacter halophilus]
MDVLKYMKLKAWPDYLFAVSASGLVVLVGIFQATETEFALSVFLLLLGMCLVSLAGKVAVYKARLSVDGNMNVWVERWRHGIVQDFIALLGLGLATFGFYQMVAPCIQ